MKIETKLATVNIQRNYKRAIYTIISIILCTTLLFTTILVISSLKKGISSSLETEYNDYQIIIRNISTNDFNKIKDKDFIEKIYIQYTDDGELQTLEKPYFINSAQNFNIFIKYTDVKDVCKNSTDIVNTLFINVREASNKVEFNEKLLTMYGLIGVGINGNLICTMQANYSYIVDLLIVLVLVVFSILFIIILYNAFLITINERKKDYAVLRSVGSTEKQILKMIFIEECIIGIIGIIIGGMLSIIFSSVLLHQLNNIMLNSGFTFTLYIDAKYILLSLVIIIINIYISSIIPSVKASSTSIMQNIRNNKQIKYKRKNSFLEKILPIEGKLALRDAKRNRNKYRTIIILLVVCITSYITVNTYIKYEEVTESLVDKYKVDAQISVDTEQNIDYKAILSNYEKEYSDNLKCIEYKMTGLNFLIEPTEAILTNSSDTYDDGKKSENMVVIGLEDTVYRDYIEKAGGNYGDIIIYNNKTIVDINDDFTTTYYSKKAFKEDYNLQISLIATTYMTDSVDYKYQKVNCNTLKNNIILTDHLLEEFSDFTTKYCAPIIFVNMDIFQSINNDVEKYNLSNNNQITKFIWSDVDATYARIKCDNIIGFSNYIENIKQKQNIEIDATYYTLDNQENIIYINIIKLMLNSILLAIIIIGIISTVNILNASLSERKQEFKIISDIGAQKKNIKNILLYEDIYMFLKATIISIIISIPIIYIIVKSMQNIIVLEKLQIPLVSICLFILMLFVMSLIVTITLAKSIKLKK